MKFGDFEKPAKVIRASVEGMLNYDMLVYIPSVMPYDYYTKAVDVNAFAKINNMTDEKLLNFKEYSKTFYEEIAEDIPLFLEEWYNQKSNFNSNITYTSNIFKKPLLRRTGYIT